MAGAAPRVPERRNDLRRFARQRDCGLERSNRFVEARHLGQRLAEEEMCEREAPIELERAFELVYGVLISPRKIRTQSEARADGERQRIELEGGFQLVGGLAKSLLRDQEIDGVPVMRDRIVRADLDRPAKTAFGFGPVPVVESVHAAPRGEIGRAAC